MNQISITKARVLEKSFVQSSFNITIYTRVQTLRPLGQDLGFKEIGMKEVLKKVLRNIFKFVCKIETYIHTYRVFFF